MPPRKPCIERKAVQRDRATRSLRPHQRAIDLARWAAGILQTDLALSPNEALLDAFLSAGFTLDELIEHGPAAQQLYDENLFFALTLPREAQS